MKLNSLKKGKSFTSSVFFLILYYLLAVVIVVVNIDVHIAKIYNKKIYNLFIIDNKVTRLIFPPS